jgi:hypothetical protein
MPYPLAGDHVFQSRIESGNLYLSKMKDSPVGIFRGAHKKISMAFDRCQILFVQPGGILQQSLSGECPALKIK